MEVITASIIVASNNIEYFKNCLLAILALKEGFDGIFVVPWGIDKDLIIAHCETNPKTQVIQHKSGTSLEENRNAALEYILKYDNHYSYVAFIDDDTILDACWLLEMKKKARSKKSDVAFSSVASPILFMTLEKDDSTIQSCGHVFKDTSPHDLLYKKSIAELETLDVEPQFPCGNSSFVPLEAIERIARYDSVWDKDFEQWQTCFSFGIKLRLVSCRCECNKAARVFHEGKVHRTGEDLKPDDIYKQLRSRILLYLKFFPEATKRDAMIHLEDKLKKWVNNGYPGSKVAGCTLLRIFQESKMAAERYEFNPYWKKMIEKMTKPEVESLLKNSH